MMDEEEKKMKRKKENLKEEVSYLALIHIRHLPMGRCSSHAYGNEHMHKPRNVVRDINIVEEERESVGKKCESVRKCVGVSESVGENVGVSETVWKKS